ncbi:MAG: hypothetical protein ACFCUO_03480 [Rhodospirillales bacterium]
MTVYTPLSISFGDHVKWAFTTRRVDRGDAVRLVADVAAAAPGDLVVGRIDRIGWQKAVQLAEGRASTLYEGDMVVLACGARYAPDQFEGIAEIGAEGADMLAAGGVLGRVRQRHERMSAPTRVIPLGLLADGNGRVLNLDAYAMPTTPRPAELPSIVVVGASMNAGKTTATASLARGLGRAGYRVAAIKATGTGAFGDFNAFRDAGATFVADFTDTGMASTYLQPLPRIAAALDTLLGQAACAGCEVAVVELADGVFQAETAALLRDPAIRTTFGGVLFAAPDALAGAGGCHALQTLGIRPVALTGKLSCSPLGAAEAEIATGIPVLTRDALCDPAVATSLLMATNPGRCLGAAA